MDITPFFQLMVDKGASDLFFTVGAPPNIKIEGKLSPVGQTNVSFQQMTEISSSIMTDDQRKEFEANLELNMALSIAGCGRFRVNMFR